MSDDYQAINRFQRHREHAPSWTPGEWQAERGNVGSEHPLFVTAPDHDGLRPWTDADACLIAAAKDLYAALQEFNGLQIPLTANEWDRKIKKARAALAKARGETL